MSQSFPILAIGEITVRQLDGLFSLNDLHKAAGGEKRHQPSDFLKIDQTKALVAEIGNSEDSRSLVTKEGRNGGTYACRELVIAYAAWISAAFHLKVIRVFLDAVQPATAPVLARPPIRSRKDLSFTRLDAESRLSNWVVKPRERLWGDGLVRGAAFFQEIVELAAHDEHEAYNAVRFAFIGEWHSVPDSGTEWNNRGPGEECGFAEAVARAMIDGLRARRDGADPYDPERKAARGRPRGKSKGPKLLPASLLTPPTQQRLLA